MKLKVLLVDDNEPVRTAIAQVLAEQAVQIVTANDGLDAVERIRQAPGTFDLVISDVEMPGLDGWALLEWVQRWYSTLPVVLMSGMSGRSFIKAARNNGARGALEKPFLGSHLRELIESLFCASTPYRDPFYFPSSMTTQIGLAAVCA